MRALKDWVAARRRWMNARPSVAILAMLVLAWVPTKVAADFGFSPPGGGGGGVTTGGDYTLGDVTADALILDQANADVGFERGVLAGYVNVTDGGAGAGSITVEDGGPTAPAYTFVGDLNVGLYRIATDSLGVTAGGRRAGFDANGMNLGTSGDVGLARNAAGVLEVTDGSTGNGTIIAAGGSASEPSFKTRDDADTGIYSSAAARLNFAINGTEGPFQLSATASIFSAANSIQWGSSGFTSPDTYIAREAAGVVKILGGSLAGWHIATASEELTALSGASASTTNLVPAGGRILNVVVRVTTTITGATSFSIGDGSDVDRYGATIALTAGTTTDHSDATADPMSWSAAAQDVTLTANGSNFTGGAVRVVATYLAAEPPGS